MKQSTGTRKRPLDALPCLAMVLAVLIISLTSGCLSGVLNGNGVVSPSIHPIPDAPAPPQPTYQFPFQTMMVTITLPVNGSVYAGAKGAEKDVTLYGNVSEEEWVAASYLAMMDDPEQELFYRDLIARLRAVRKNASLTDDEYLELIAVFVQSIPYETTGENPPKFPVETFTDGSGDCDDKSLLLAGLLSREGYRVALLPFRQESHMAVGVVCPGIRFRSTEYAYIETTNVSFIGVPPDGLSGGVVISSDPLVIPVGTGTKNFDACNQTLYLRDLFASTEKQFTGLSREADAVRSELRELAALKNVNAYNQRLAYYNGLVSRLKRNAEVHNYILTHQHDRKGSYNWARAHLSGL